MSSASRSASTSISAMNSWRVSSPQVTSDRRRLVTKPLMWLSGRRSSWAVAARMSSAEDRCWWMVCTEPLCICGPTTSAWH
jgi:hypothetical protein